MFIFTTGKALFFFSVVGIAFSKELKGFYKKHINDSDKLISHSSSITKLEKKADAFGSIAVSHRDRLERLEENFKVFAGGMTDNQEEKDQLTRSFNKGC